MVDGSSTLFWRDHWVEGNLLSNMLSRLYGLAENKMETVTKLFFFGVGRECRGVEVVKVIVCVGGRTCEKTLQVSNICFAGG